MQVSELIREEKYGGYVNRLIDKEKLRFLGQGKYGSVFQHPEFSNVAVKVFKATDNAYRKYLRWCLRNQSNKYVPRIISVHYRGDGKKIGIVFMKKLRRASKKQITELAKHATALMYSGNPEMYDSSREELRFLKAHMDFELFTNEDWDDLADAARRRDPDLASFAEFMVKSRTNGGDVHRENIMVDEQGQLVFTDPIA